MRQRSWVEKLLIETKPRRTNPRESNAVTSNSILFSNCIWNEIKKKKLQQKQEIGALCNRRHLLPIKSTHPKIFNEIRLLIEMDQKKSLKFDGVLSTLDKQLVWKTIKHISKNNISRNGNVCQLLNFFYPTLECCKFCWNSSYIGAAFGVFPFLFNCLASPRQACSSQIQYLSNSTKITTTIVTAILSTWT